MGLRVGRMEAVPGQVEIRAGWVEIEGSGRDALRASSFGILTFWGIRCATGEVRTGNEAAHSGGPTKNAACGVRRADVPPVFISA